MTAVSQDQAIQESKDWMDHKKVRPSKREALKPQIETIVDGLTDGWLSINPDDFNMKMKLSFPIEGCSELTIKSRIKPIQIKPYLKNVKPGDSDGRLLAYCCALTGQNSGIIGEMDSEDYGALCDIVSFFF